MGHDSNDNALHQPRHEPELRNGDTETLEGCGVEVKTSACEDDHQSYLSTNRCHIPRINYQLRKDAD